MLTEQLYVRQVAQSRDVYVKRAAEEYESIVRPLPRKISHQLNVEPIGDGSERAAQQKVNGGPSVLYDAVVILTSAEGAAMLTQESTAKDFVSDAFVHAKFFAYAGSASSLLAKPGDGGAR